MWDKHDYLLNVMIWQLPEDCSLRYQNIENPKAAGLGERIPRPSVHHKRPMLQLRFLLCLCAVHSTEPEAISEPPKEEPPLAEAPAAGATSGRRNPPGGKSSLILG